MLQPINLRDLVILLADPNAYVRRVIREMLRSFGANKVLEVESAPNLLMTLVRERVDLLICDARLPPHDALTVTRTIRKNPESPHRTIPILVMSGDSREATIRGARDAGANMVITKPTSPRNLYDRLTWIAFTPRNFVDTATYFGPDRRFKIEGYPGAVGRRKGDQDVEVAQEAGPALAQNEIDNLFSAARTGSS